MLHRCMRAHCSAERTAVQVSQSAVDVQETNTRQSIITCANMHPKFRRSFLRHLAGTEGIFPPGDFSSRGNRH